jgi:hypothetical protein
MVYILAIPFIIFTLLLLWSMFGNWFILFVFVFSFALLTLKKLPQILK